MRIRHYPMACELLAGIFVTGAEHAFRVASGFPLDARIRDVFLELDPEGNGRVVLAVESREFQDVKPFEEPPERAILIEDRKEQMLLAKAALASSATKPPN